MAASNGHNKAAEILMQHGAKPTETVYCYRPIKWAPPHMYDGITGKLPTCDVFLAKVKKEYPGMGLLEEES
jgi:hypothetical protein